MITAANISASSPSTRIERSSRRYGLRASARALGGSEPSTPSGSSTLRNGRLGSAELGRALLELRADHRQRALQAPAPDELLDGVAAVAAPLLGQGLGIHGGRLLQVAGDALRQGGVPAHVRAERVHHAALVQAIERDVDRRLQALRLIDEHEVAHGLGLLQPARGADRGVDHEREDADPDPEALGLDVLGELAPGDEEGVTHGVHRKEASRAS
jgi:hypothetical protein